MRASLSTLLSAAAAAFTVTTLPAQDLVLQKTGGALGGATVFDIHGQPGEPYALLLDVQESRTYVPALDLNLLISDQYAGLTYTAPGMLGFCDANGDAHIPLTMRNKPGLVLTVFSLQAVAGFGPFRASNLVRITPQRAGTFQAALNAPGVPIAGGGALLAEDDEVLFVGGSGPVAQRYASRTETWQLAGVTFGVGLLSQTTPLQDGRVLFTGGLDLTTGQPTATAAIYDPATGATTELTMGSARAGHGASQLGNGRVLITGGIAGFDLTDPLSLFSGILGTSEYFDPATDTFSSGPALLEPRALHTSTTLTTGDALIAGGITLIPFLGVPTVSSNAYRFNPNTGSFGLPAFFTGARFLHSAVALSDGRVLIAGGLSLDLSGILQSGELTDLAIGTRDDCVRFQTGLFGFGSFETVAGLSVGRAAPAIAPLPNGGALIAGGFQLGVDLTTQEFVADATATADVFSPSPNTLTPTGSMAAPRLFPVATPLPDGTVLIVGGGPLEAEVYQY